MLKERKSLPNSATLSQLNNIPGDNCNCQLLSQKDNETEEFFI